MSNTACSRRCDRRWMVVCHCFTLFATAVIAALLVPETSLTPTADRATYLAWAAFAALMPAAPAFLLRRRHPVVVGYWRLSSALALVAFLGHIGYTVALEGWQLWPVLLAAWWLGDSVVAATSPLGTTTAGSRLRRAGLLGVVLLYLGGIAWNSGVLLPRLLVVLAAAAILVALGWRAPVASSTSSSVA